MEKFVAEAQTAYFWIFAAFTFVVGLFVNYSMKPIDTVRGRVSAKWKARAEKKWEGLRDQANTFHDDRTREHVQWLCLAYGQRSIWNLISGIVGSAMVLFVMVARIGLQEPATSGLWYNFLAFVVGGTALWRLYTAARYDKAVTRMQAALELHDDFHQIRLQAHEDDEIANAALLAATDTRNDTSKEKADTKSA